MTDLAAQILVLAKEPVPGRVKTRLTPRSRRARPPRWLRRR